MIRLEMAGECPVWLVKVRLGMDSQPRCVAVSCVLARLG